VRASLVIVCFAVAQLVPLFAQTGGQTLEERRAKLNRLLNDEWEYTLRTQPELATHVGDDRYNDRLSDFSGQAIAALCAMHAGYHSWHAGGLVRRMPAYPLPDKLVYLAGFGLLLRGRDLIELR